MKRIVLIALACFAMAGCKKYRDQPVQSNSSDQGGGSGGAVQAVRGAATRTVTAAELHDLHLFMTNAKLSMGRVPTSQETWAEISQPSGNPKLTQMIREGLIVLVPNPQDEGLWAYDKNAPTQGGWVLMHSEPRRVTAQEFAGLARQ
ncbi:MAG: hypothetical protein EXS09_13855 [Gemmataceae bacterium]|nr:hypothetical protein [Gemmataceae bacterium]